MRVSRWYLTYSLVSAIAILAVWDAQWIVRYWPTITSTLSEVYQCAAGSH